MLVVCDAKSQGGAGGFSSCVCRFKESREEGTKQKNVVIKTTKINNVKNSGKGGHITVRLVQNGTVPVGHQQLFQRR